MDCANCHNPIPPDWAYGSIGFIGEAPGLWEARARRNFVGKSGEELDAYLWPLRLPRSRCYIDNVLACHPPGDRNPLSEEIKGCRERLLINIEKAHPQVIVPLGAFATKFFLGQDADLAAEHGIPHRWVTPAKEISELDGTIVPTWHPARVLHGDSFFMQHIKDDIAMAVGILRGEKPKAHIQDAHPNPAYSSVTSPAHLQRVLAGANVIAMDTETLPDGIPYFVSLSVLPGVAYVVKVERGSPLLELLALHSSRRGVKTVLHNALFDLVVLEKMGIRPANVEDTMVMAYLLQTLPQKLKLSAYRLCGMKMEDFDDLCRPYSARHALEYLVEAMMKEWPKPEAVLEWSKGEAHVRQPQPLTKRLAGIVRDYAKDPALDIWARWDVIDGKELVEKEMGNFPRVSIGDVPLDEAVYYSARDADATLRVYLELERRIG